jgi:hypothetical protein
MVPWYARADIDEYLIDVSASVQDGQIDDAICACIRIGMSDEEIDEFLDSQGAAR